MERQFDNMRERQRLNLLLISAVVLSALLAFGCAARKPSSLETSVMTGVKKITVGGKREINPLADTVENIESGRRVFLERCAFCHGSDGRNTGISIADRMSPPVPVLSSPSVQQYSDGQLKWIVENGLYPSGMPSFKGILSQDDVWKIVRYIRNLPAKGDPGDVSAGGEQGMHPHSDDGRAVMSNVKKITPGGRTETNSLADNAENLAFGRRVFLARCVFCHESDGRNAGVSGAKSASPPAPALSSPGIQEFSDRQLESIIENGASSSGMPSFRGVLTQDDISKVVRYIRHLPSNRSVADVSANGEQQVLRHSGHGG